MERRRGRTPTADIELRRDLCECPGEDEGELDDEFAELNGELATEYCELSITIFCQHIIMNSCLRRARKR